MLIYTGIMFEDIFPDEVNEKYSIPISSDEVNEKYSIRLLRGSATFIFRLV